MPEMFFTINAIVWFFIILLTIHFSIKRIKGNDDLKWILVLATISAIWFFEPAIISRILDNSYSEIINSNDYGTLTKAFNVTFITLKEVIIGFYRSVALFAVGLDLPQDMDIYNIFSKDIVGEHSIQKGIFSAYGYLAFIISPILTFDFVISQFTQIKEDLKSMLSWRANRHVFSELNEHSMALAESIYSVHNEVNAKKQIFTKSFAEYKALKKGQSSPKFIEILKENYKKYTSRVQIVFTDVYKQNNENTENLLQRAKAINAICLKRDIVSIKEPVRFYIRHRLSKNSKESDDKEAKKTKFEQRFYYISNDENENLAQVQEMKSNKSITNQNSNAFLYLFSQSTISDIATNTMLETDNKNLQILRINPAYYTLVDHIYNNGYKLFDNARIGKSGKKEINAIIIGYGGYGKILTKMLLWYCEMPGYQLSLTVIDEREGIEAEFRHNCPKIDLKDSNLHFIDGCNVLSNKLNIALSKIDNPSYIFVATGDDEKNIDVAASIRRLTMTGPEPQFVSIDAIVESTEKSKALKDNKYGINLIGSIQSVYNNKIILEEDIINSAYGCHTSGASNSNQSSNITYNKNEFYSNEYNLNSTMATVLHWKLRKYLVEEIIDGINEELPDNEKFDYTALNEAINQLYIGWKVYNVYLKEKKLSRDDYPFITIKSIQAENDDKKIQMAINESEASFLDKLRDANCELLNNEKHLQNLSLFFFKMVKIEKDRWNTYVKLEGFKYKDKDEVGIISNLMINNISDKSISESEKKALKTLLRINANIVPFKKLDNSALDGEATFLINAFFGVIDKFLDANGKNEAGWNHKSANKD